MSIYKLKILKSIFNAGNYCHVFGGIVYLNDTRSGILPGTIERLTKLGYLEEIRDHHFKISDWGKEEMFKVLKNG